MSRKRRMDTVLRVAELRERAARVDLSASQAAFTAAQAASRSRLSELHALRPLVAANPSGWLAQQTVSSLRAMAVTAAREAEAQSGTQQDAALEAWKAAAQREKALESLAAHQRELQEQEANAAEQRLLDDLGALWSRPEWEPPGGEEQ